jgi:pimeloyl-ACP methyl ester carboxylesterase
MPTINVQGTPVHYHRTGTGPAVVLLHGGGLDNAHLSWGLFTTLLAGRAMVIAPDLPGFGDSSLGATRPTVTGLPAGSSRDEVRWSGPRTVFGAELAELACPVLLLSGEHDLIDPGAVCNAAATIPNGAFALISDAWHWLPRDAPEAVADQLLKLISAAKPPHHRLATRQE